LVILEIGSCFLPRPDWTTIQLFMVPIIAGITGVYHQAQLLVERVSHELPALTGIKPRFSWSQLSKQIGLQAWATGSLMKNGVPSDSEQPCISCSLF
jgi:hypothetical protein